MKKKKYKLDGYVPHGIHKTKGLVYFSTTRQKWVGNIGKLKIDDILSTPTVPIEQPQKILKKARDLGMAKIEINIEI